MRVANTKTRKEATTPLQVQPLPTIRPSQFNRTLQATQHYSSSSNSNTRSLPLPSLRILDDTLQECNQQTTATVRALQPQLQLQLLNKIMATLPLHLAATAQDQRPSRTDPHQPQDLLLPLPHQTVLTQPYGHSSKQSTKTVLSLIFSPSSPKQC